MYRFIRTATVRNAALLPQALAFAAEVTKHVNARHSVNMRFGVEQYGAPRVHWHFDVDSLDAMQKMNSALMEDRDYIGMLTKVRDTWVDGGLKDTLVRLA